MNAEGTQSARAPSALVWLVLSALVLALDQASKYWVIAELPEHTAVPVIDGVWNWYRSYNSGAAFSLLSGAGGWQQTVFGILAIAVSALLGRWLYLTPRGAYRAAVPYALVIGGALGNLVDRLLRGHVVDFIQWHWRGHYWPTFNVADAAIVIGALAMVLLGVAGPITKSRRDSVGIGQ